jgi:hypothetical protein
MLPTDGMGVIMSDVGAYNTDMSLMSDEIKEGDWCIEIHPTGNGLIPYRLFKAKYVYEENGLTMVGDDDESINVPNVKKVLGSTDKTLLLSCQCGYKENDKGVKYHKMSCKNKYYLPSIPESFIKEYVDNKGVDEVLVRYMLYAPKHPHANDGTLVLDGNELILEQFDGINITEYDLRSFLNNLEPSVYINKQQAHLLLNWIKERQNL